MRVDATGVNVALGGRRCNAGVSERFSIFSIPPNPADCGKVTVSAVHVISVICVRTL